MGPAVLKNESCKKKDTLKTHIPFEQSGEQLIIRDCLQAAIASI